MAKIRFGSATNLLHFMDDVAVGWPESKFPPPVEELDRFTVEVGDQDLAQVAKSQYGGREVQG